MRTRLFAVVLFSAFVTLASPPSQAAPCVGFADVDDTSAFCPNVEWITIVVSVENRNPATSPLDEGD